LALIIKNATAVLKDRLMENAALIIEDGIIQDILPMCACTYKTAGFIGTDGLDAKGMLVMPGMIDIHSDAVEKEVEPRPDIRFPLELALSQLERRLASQGLTSVFHSLSFAGGDGVRDDRVAQDIIDKIKQRPRSVIRNFVHLRYEITNFKSLPVVRELLQSGRIDLFSIMDHSPGQGQYRTHEDYAQYVRKTYRLPEEQIAKIAEERLTRREMVSPEALAELVQFAKKYNIPVASHDDDSVAKINWGRSSGISIAEFPINIETAQAATDAGLFVLVGSPNIARGGSHNGNLSALDLIKAGCANAICSDYYTASMLYAVFKVAQAIHDLPAAVRMVTLNPASAIQKEKIFGSLEPGKQADLIIVETGFEIPVVHKTFVNGKLVYSGDYWNCKTDHAPQVGASQAVQGDVEMVPDYLTGGKYGD
jgi:alpha-D-ribose 1-methylphosphonate 5-triphosphate diphosphatase